MTAEEAVRAIQKLYPEQYGYMYGLISAARAVDEPRASNPRMKTLVDKER